MRWDHITTPGGRRERERERESHGFGPAVVHVCLRARGSPQGHLHQGVLAQIRLGLQPAGRQGQHLLGQQLLQLFGEEEKAGTTGTALNAVDV